MRTLDQLTDSEIRALGRFITGCLRIRGTSYWRTRFTECAARGRFVPYVNLVDETHLQDLIDRHGESIVCRMRTRELLKDGSEIPLTLEHIPVALKHTSSSQGTV